MKAESSNPKDGHDVLAAIMRQRRLDVAEARQRVSLGDLLRAAEGRRRERA